MRNVVCAVLVLASAGAFLKAADEPQTIEQVYKNIQVLKGIPAAEISQDMTFISVALGVTCAYCHTPSGPWPQGFEKDDIKAKQTAREMIRMTRQINEASFAGRSAVTCATCHAGHTSPVGSVPVDTPEAVKEKIAPPVRSETGPLPTPEELFAKFAKAIGGEAAISKLTTRHVITTANTAGPPARIELIATSRGLILQTTTAGPQAATIGFDGTHAYNVSGGAVTLASGLNEDNIKLGAFFYRNLRLGDPYSSARTLRKEKLGGKDVYVVSGVLKLERFTDLLFFDVESGFLLRRITMTRTAMGPLPQTEDFENYREVDGVKVSMDQLRSVPGLAAGRWHIEEIRFNEPIDDAKFAMPAAPPK
jgi:hypothetical protein